MRLGDTLEGDHRAIRRETRTRLHARMRCQAPDVAAVEIRHPQVVGVGESDVVPTDSRIGQQAGVIDVDAIGAGTDCDQQRHQYRFHRSSEIGQ